MLWPSRICVRKLEAISSLVPHEHRNGLVPPFRELIVSSLELSEDR